MPLRAGGNGEAQRWGCCAARGMRSCRPDARYRRAQSRVGRPAGACAAARWRGVSPGSCPPPCAGADRSPSGAGCTSDRSTASPTARTAHRRTPHTGTASAPSTAPSPSPSSAGPAPCPTCRAARSPTAPAPGARTRRPTPVGPREVHLYDHPPMIPDPPLQAHLSLDSPPPFRLMFHWTKLGVDFQKKAVQYREHSQGESD